MFVFLLFNKEINFFDLLIFQFIFKIDFFASSGVLDDLIILITLSKFSTDTDKPINMCALSSAFCRSYLVFLTTTSSLNDKKLVEIANLGEKSFTAVGEGGQERAIKAQVCEVNKALLSVHRMVQAGNTLVFSRYGSSAALQVLNHVYEIELRSCRGGPGPRTCRRT